MTARKIKRNSGCKDCDHFIGAYNQIGGNGSVSYDCRCENEKGEEIQHDPVAGEIIEQKWEPLDQNKDCTCPGFSDEKKKQRKKDEQIRVIVSDEIAKIDSDRCKEDWKDVFIPTMHGVKFEHKPAVSTKLAMLSIIVVLVVVPLLAGACYWMAVN